MRLLETAVERPGSYQLTHGWVATDPDLDSLRDDERFKRFHAGLFQRRPASDPDG